MPSCIVTPEARWPALLLDPAPGFASSQFQNRSFSRCRCRYLGRAIDELRRRGVRLTDEQIAGLSPLGWDRINLSGDYVWSDSMQLDTDGFMPLIGSGRLP